MITRGRDAVVARRSVSRETLSDLDAYAELLAQWQRRTNLVAPSTLPDLWTRHFEEGLELGALVPRQAGSIADLGSGAGFPGLVLAILRKRKGTGTVALVESNGKKAAFLRAVVRELDLPCTVHAERIERCDTIISTASVVTARALAPLPELLDMVGGRLSPGAICLFPKGLTHEVEIAAASAQWRYHMVKHASASGPGSVILEISDVSPLR